VSGEVSFDSDPALGDLQPGDFWTFAARASDGTVQSLMQAPPQGIHHHYARLSVLTLPLSKNQPSDCRTPWPPEEGGGCDCASCVSAESHNNGSWTIQNGIDAVRGKGGGKVCLGPGTYSVASTIMIDADAEGITLCGHGMPVLLPTGATGSILLIQNATEIVVEGIVFVGGNSGGIEIDAPGPASALIGITISDSFFVTVQDCIFGSPSDTVPLSSGIAHSDVVIYSTVQRNFFTNVVVGLKLTNVTGNNDSLAYLVNLVGTVLSQVTITENEMYCNSGALWWQSERFSVSEIRFANNVVQSASGVVISATGFQDDVAVEGNTFVITAAVASDDYPYDAAVVCSCPRTRVTNNEIFGNTSTLTVEAGNGGTIGPGTYVWVVTALDAANRESLVTSFATLTLSANQNAATLSWGTAGYALKYNVYRTQANQDRLLLVDSIDGNTLSFFDTASDTNIGKNLAAPVMQNDGIVLGLPSGTVVMYGSQVTDNRISGLTGAGILALAGATVVETVISRNQLLSLGGSGMALADLAVDIDIVGNSILGAGLNPTANIAGIGLLGVFNANISENRIEVVGPAAAGITVLGIEILLGADVRLAGNHIADIGPVTSSTSFGVYVYTPVASYRLDVVNNEIRRASILPKTLQHPGWLALALLGDTVNVRGNLLESVGQVSGDGIPLGKTLVQASTAYISANGSCLFSDNQCFQDYTSKIARPLVVAIVAKTIIAMGNRIQGPGAKTGQFSMSLEDGSAGKAGMLTAVGNITTAGIGVPDTPLSVPWAPLNIKVN
jgi:hypothetical protein